MGQRSLEDLLVCEPERWTLQPDSGVVLGWYMTLEALKYQNRGSGRESLTRIVRVIVFVILRSSQVNNLHEIPSKHRFSSLRFGKTAFSGTHSTANFIWDVLSE